MDRKITVQSVFRRFLIWFCISTVAIVVFCLLLLLTVTSTGMVRPANYGETGLESNRAAIESAKRVTEDLIPAGCEFGVYEEDGTYLYGSFSGQRASEVWETYEKEKTSSGPLFLKVFQREGEICLAVYRFKADYVNPIARKFLPGIEVAVPLLFLLLFLLEVILLTRHFSCLIRRELSAVKQVTESVARQDLEFEKPDSKIREVDEVMTSLSEMRDALTASLKQQWKQRDIQRQQLGALIHDVKTPLTVIQGNAQLSQEAESVAEIREYQEDILEETERISGYVRILQEMLNSSEKLKYRNEPVNILQAAEAFAERAGVLSLARKRHVEVKISLPSMQASPAQGDRAPDVGGVGDGISSMSGEIYCDGEFLRRSWENLLENALEYTKKGGNIRIEIGGDAGKLWFQIEDDGPGFSEEALRRGTEEFYCGDKSRNGRNHYGMGLFIVESFAKHQGGSLKLGNSPSLGGGYVVLEIPGYYSRRNRAHRCAVSGQ